MAITKTITDGIWSFISIMFAPVIVVVFLVGGFFVVLYQAIEDIRTGGGE